MIDNVIQIPLPILAKALARYHESEASATMKGTSAAILCDTFDALRAANPSVDALEFWRVIEDARRAERDFWRNWAAEARARKSQAIGDSESPGEGS